MTKDPTLNEQIKKLSDKMVALRNTRSRLTGNSPEGRRRIARISAMLNTKQTEHRKLLEELKHE